LPTAAADLLHCKHFAHLTARPRIATKIRNKLAIKIRSKVATKIRSKVATKIHSKTAHIHSKTAHRISLSLGMQVVLKLRDAIEIVSARLERHAA
jgi:hypothetical protein